MKSENYNLKSYLMKNLNFFKQEKECEYYGFEKKVMKVIDLYQLKLKNCVNSLHQIFVVNMKKSELISRLRNELNALKSRLEDYGDINGVQAGKDSEIEKLKMEIEENLKFKDIASVKGIQAVND